MQNNPRLRLQRTVRAVQVTVTSQSNAAAGGGGGAPPVDGKAPAGEASALACCLTKTVEPHNDYFSAQFLLSFGAAGLHQVRQE